MEQSALEGWKAEFCKTSHGKFCKGGNFIACPYNVCNLYLDISSYFITAVYNTVYIVLCIHSILLQCYQACLLGLNCGSAGNLISAVAAVRLTNSLTRPKVEGWSYSTENPCSGIINAQL